MFPPISALFSIHELFLIYSFMYDGCSFSGGRLRMAWRPALIAVAFAMALAISMLEPTTAEASKDILLDTDVDVDDIFAIVYLLKQKRWGINLKAISISANAWSDAGHAINHVYDVLHMMGRDDIPVGVGGEGGITFKGHIFPNVGGYLPLIEQMLSTSGGCRYRQAIPPGPGGTLDVDTMYGLRKQFLPQGERHYVPLKQPTAQEVMLDALSSGPTTVILIGSHTNFAALLMTHPEVKDNVEHIYIMGGGVNSSNPTGCCPKNSATSCVPGQCGDRGNIFDAVDSNPWAEFNIFSDPFAAYQVFHSGIPITLVPLDATNTIPLTKNFFSFLERNQHTFEAQYIYQSLKMVRDTWFDNYFYQSYFMWDSFASGIAVSGILNNHNIEANAFAVISIKDVTVVTSNKPYGIQDGSNPFFDNRTIPKFHLPKGGVHSGHVQTGLQDPFCLVPNGKGKCMDGYTMETSGPEAVRMQVGRSAKPNTDVHINLEFAFFKSFIESLNDPEDTAHYNFETQFPCYKEVLFKPKSMGRQMGKALIFDMDMSPGDFITLFYLLKMPRELIDLKAITVTATGWASAATIDIVYDVLHMMGRDDIAVGLGEYFANGQAYAPLNNTGDCRYRQSIPNGAGGLIDSDTLFGLARDLPRSPRRYTAHNSVKYGSPRNTEYPKLRQPLAQEVLTEVIGGLDKSSKVTILTGGPVTNIAKLLASNSSFKSSIEELYITGESIHENHFPSRKGHLGNVFTVPQNNKAEFNMFLDPMAAEQVFQAGVKVILTPLDARRGVTLSTDTIKKLEGKKTAEAAFVHNLLLTIQRLQMQKKIYNHTAKLAGGEALAAAVMVDRLRKKLRGEFGEEALRVVASGDISGDGWTRAAGGGKGGRSMEYVRSVDIAAYKEELVEALNRGAQSAVVGSFAAQTRPWLTCRS